LAALFHGNQQINAENFIHQFQGGKNHSSQIKYSNNKVFWQNLFQNKRKCVQSRKNKGNMMWKNQK
jgi:hypothetical protein